MPYKNYQVTEIKTSDPVRIVILLYEGAIKNLNQALRFHAEGNYPGASARIVKAQEIVSYLRTTLNYEQGGEIAGNLDRLYEYAHAQLVDANLKRDANCIRNVIPLLQTLLEGWQGIAGNQTDGDAVMDTEDEEAAAEAAAPMAGSGAAPQKKATVLAGPRPKFSAVVG